MCRVREAVQECACRALCMHQCCLHSTLSLMDMPCRYATGYCREKGHTLQSVKVTERYFECRHCRERTTYVIYGSGVMCVCRVWHR